MLFINEINIYNITLFFVFIFIILFSKIYSTISTFYLKYRKTFSLKFFYILFNNIFDIQFFFL